jgi:hypothetical protein
MSDEKDTRFYASAPLAKAAREKFEKVAADEKAKSDK